MNRKSQRRSELAPKVINSKVPAVQFQLISELAPKGINYEAPEKEKRNPENESPGIFILKGDPSWRQKEVIPRCQRDNSYVVYNYYVDPSWHEK